MWAVTLILLTCLGIDFSNPLLPGVVRFSEEESVHALRAERSRTGERPAETVARRLEPGRSVEIALRAPRPPARGFERPRPPSAASRPRASIDAGRATIAAEDH